MIDKEKVIMGLECCIARNGICRYKQEPICPYVEHCQKEDYVALQRDTLALLKEQEAVEPIYIENPYTHLPVSYCSKCREPINQYITGNPYRKTEYCHYCGQAVKWE